MAEEQDRQITADDRYRHRLTGMIVVVAEFRDGFVYFTTERGHQTTLSPLPARVFLREFERLKHKSP